MAGPATETSEDLITPSLVARFCATLDLPAPRMGDELPPGLHWCLCAPDAPLSALGLDGHPGQGIVTAPPGLPRRMWAASEIAWHGPLPTGGRVTRHSRLVSMEPRSGRQGPLALATIDHEWEADGRPVITERQTLVYRGAAEAGQAPPPEPATQTRVPGERVPGEIVERIAPSTVLLFRYSALTFNSHRIHYDLPYATEIEGYPGLVVQGPLLATLLMQLARHTLGAPLRTFVFRAVRPAHAGQRLDLTARHDGAGLQLAVSDPSGADCMTARATASA